MMTWNPVWLPVSTNWKPIETAPKDGSVILVRHTRGTWMYPKDQKRINCRVVFWRGDHWAEFGPHTFTPDEVSHWMPFDEPPA